MSVYNGINTSGFHNATGQAGTIGSVMETSLTLGPGGKFSFDWAFLGNDQSPWNDFALFYLKGPGGDTIVFSEGLAQIGPRPGPNAHPFLGPVAGQWTPCSVGQKAKGWQKELEA